VSRTLGKLVKKSILVVLEWKRRLASTVLLQLCASQLQHKQNCGDLPQAICCSRWPSTSPFSQLLQ
jgi:hypothetical protein